MPEISEPDVNTLAVYSIRGSKRNNEPEERMRMAIDSDGDLIQIAHFEKSLPLVITNMRKGEIDRKQKEEGFKKESFLSDEMKQKME